MQSSQRENQLKLDIDAGWNPGGPYPYTWRPETGNFMYCMPQVGTRVSLYCPNYDEKAAIAVNCVRTNGGDCDRMSDPAKRSFVTEHGKEMNLYPGEMSLLGGSNGSFNLSDEDGITIGLKKPIVIIANEEVKFEAAQVATQALVGEIVAAKGDPVTGDVDSSLVMCNNYDAVAPNITGAEGWNCVEYEPYDDAPEESSFDVGALVGNILAGIAVAAVVGMFVAASILFFPALIAAATGTAIATGTLMAAGAIGGITAVAGAVAAIGTGIEDIKSGEVRDRSVYIRNSYNVAATTGGFLQTAYGLYNLVQFARQLPNILNNLGRFFSSLGNPGPGGLVPALAGAGANGSIAIISGTAEAVEILTDAQALVGLQSWVLGSGMALFASTSPSPSNPSGVRGTQGTYNRRTELMNRAENGRLKNAINELFRSSASTGDGGSAAKLVEEVDKGILNDKGNYPHYQKVCDKINELTRILNEENLTASDQSIIRELLNDLYNARKYANGIRLY